MDRIPAATAEILKAGTEILQPAPGMSIARAGHTATLLSNGKILIAGGDTPLPSPPPFSGPASTAELYDPVSGTSTPAGGTTVAPSGLAVLLLNGKVLFVGAGSAELYDPSTDSFTLTCSPTLPGSGNGSTATLLPDGRVLLAGGFVAEQNYPGVSVDTAELYDPATGQFTPTGNMTVPRSSHTATLLPDGTVLLAGGLGAPIDSDNLDTPATDTTEIFNPSTNTFTPSHAMKTPREYHTATLLPDGTVLFVGGAVGNPSLGAEIFH